ncbi:MAG: hypothetical protein AAF725_23340, partial [Acidobacteriota bacterium]
MQKIASLHRPAARSTLPGILRRLPRAAALGSTLAGSALLCLIASGCRPAALTPEDVVGDWRAVLASPGGELPFTLRLEDSGDWLRAVAINGDEQAPFSEVALEGRSVRLEFDWYDAEITAEMTPEGDLAERRLLVAVDRHRAQPVAAVF